MASPRKSMDKVSPRKVVLKPLPIPSSLYLQPSISSGGLNRTLRNCATPVHMPDMPDTPDMPDMPRHTISIQHNSSTGGLDDTLRKGIRRFGFPSWGRLHREGEPRTAHAQSGERVNFTLTLNPEVQSYKPGQAPPEVEFTEAVGLIHEIRKVLLSATQEGTIFSHYSFLLEEEMSALVYSSNANERAGLDLEETRRICRRVFRGGKVEASEVDTTSPAYEVNLEYLKRVNGIKAPGVEDVIRSRREIIQHAKALHYIVDKSLNRDQPLTEDLIKDTHRILSDRVPLGDEFTGDPARAYAGEYRTTAVMAGSTMFCSAQDVPREIKKLVAAFNEDVRDREDSGKLDPFYLAADICQDFVMIHPFLDGNGRMCRLLMNAYLIKYAGVVVNIGDNDAERTEYMAIVMEACEVDQEETARGKLGRMVLERGVVTLRKLKDRLHAPSTTT